jgi:DNA polymerase-3 subunit gamma/tau
MVLVRIAYVADMPTPDEAIKMIERTGGASPAIAASAAPRGAPGSTMTSAPVSSVQPLARTAVAPRAGAEASLRPQMAPASETQSQPALRITSFPQLIALAAEKRDLLTKAALEADVRLVRIEDGRLELALERHASKGLINDLSRKLEQWTGKRWTVIVSNEAGQPTLRAQTEAAKSQRERAVESDPRVQEVMARFPGAKVVEVRKLAAEAPESDDISEDSTEIPDDDL